MGSWGEKYTQSLEPYPPPPAPDFLTKQRQLIIRQSILIENKTGMQILLMRVGRSTLGWKILMGCVTPQQNKNKEFSTTSLGDLGMKSQVNARDWNEGRNNQNQGVVLTAGVWVGRPESRESQTDELGFRNPDLPEDEQTPRAARLQGSFKNLKEVQEVSPSAPQMLGSRVGKVGTQSGDWNQL